MARAAFSPAARNSSILALALCLAACGGGNGGPQPGPNPSNSPPAFNNQGPGNVPENTAGTFHTAIASDPDNDPLTFSIAGGVDAARFAISQTGALSFVQPPDFEDPSDSDFNNSYVVRIAVSDGMTSTVQDLVVTVTNAGPDAFRVARVGTGFARPLYLTGVPDGSGRVFVVEQIGRIRILNPATGAISPTIFLDVQGEISTVGERGLLGFAPAPDFQASGTFYVYLTNTAGNIEVRRYRTVADRSRADPATADIILAIPHPGFTNHNGGWLEFGPDGFLYMGTGDGGGGGDPNNNAQNTTALLGKILRIDPRTDAFPTDDQRDYAIPASNPFAAAGGRPEVWAYGLRNPFRNSFDSATGNLWIGDVGEASREEIDLMRPTDGGANFGWPIVEGTAPFRGPPQATFTMPVAEYLHGSGPRQGFSVTGGYVYRGPIEALRGNYIFGDYVTGNLWSIPVRQVSLGTTIPSSNFTIRRGDFTPVAGTINNVPSFGVDQQGNLYIVDIDGDIFRIEPA